MKYVIHTIGYVIHAHSDFNSAYIHSYSQNYNNYTKVYVLSQICMYRSTKLYFTNTFNYRRFIFVVFVLHACVDSVNYLANNHMM